mmetsp:Transcript_23931/g.36612  ORF Transcript_23931/g.36612 Transcript_23931/m.36612 type:complete len:173 (-) Transcript_23931:33-551(-)
MKQTLQTVALVLVAATFFFQAYQILMEPEKQSSKMFKQYADFRIWSNRAQRKMLGGSTLLEFPSSEYVKPYKQKATYIIAYINLLGGVGMVIGEQSMIIPLAIIHALQMFLRNNPFNVDASSQSKYDNNMRAFLVDVILLWALLIVLFDKHPLGGGEKKSTKVQKDKKVKKA